MDLRDLWRPSGGQSRLTWRLLGSLIRHLPPESATKTAIRNAMPEGDLRQASQAADPSTGQWSQTEMLLAQLIDAVRYLRYTMLRLEVGSKAGKPPELVPRPGVSPKTPRKRQLTQQQRELLFHRIHGGHIDGHVLGQEAQPATVRRQVPNVPGS
ncbi:hypothetical protein Sme01_02830 [Sphaerisporangium melleum]|uniref:Uncharacterized protein n=1 Tax=Sphaerisporangium melleum TaxID=321316 RepID=A0A917QP10_9ACTN|nr:hypothetical protein [Sphaerisporangium melleum]GGK61192.1 hypothetical protein GCM10007964_00370 [Sphaerisporangium melleum]GII67807.1 hypothetical protein Sme01_02830 [Sphaerisporangium melleum]